MSAFGKSTPVMAVCCCVLWSITAVGQSLAPDPLFQSDTPLNITLTAPFAEIDRDRDKEKDYAGTLSYVDESGQEIVLDVSLEVRGNWRLQKDNCRFSQLWVDLKRGQTENTLFAEQNRLKLVVQCASQDRYRDYVVKERQLYQAFTALSELNFDTRLLNATYVYSDDAGEQRTHLAFFIEHQNRLRDRFGMGDVELNSVAYADLDPMQSTLVGLFMYLIGNTDYSMTSAAAGDECCHNAKLLVDAAGRYFPIPYDFDASGFVDASYAPVPNPEFGLRNNRDRLYRGYCVPATQLTEAVAHYMAARDAINAIVSDTTYLEARPAQRGLTFVDEFYEVLQDASSLQREIVELCRG